MPHTAKKLAAAFVAAVAAIALVPLGADAATNVSSPSNVSTASWSTPIGVWRGTVEFGSSANVTLAFFPGGRACLRSSATDGSGATGQGTGTWQATGARTFTYEIRERSMDASGTTVGFVDIHQNATQTGNTFTSSGMSDILDVNGNLITTVESRVSASRVLALPRC
jgi:hypothetical protein